MTTIEYWKGKSLQQYNKETNNDVKEVRMQDETGTLIMRPNGNEYRKLPSLLDKAANLASTAVAAGQGLLNGKPVIAPDAMIESRLAICKACGYYDPKAFCRSCGCVTSAKVRLSASHCPEGKWRSL